MIPQIYLSLRHYPPELQAELTLVNFTVTPLGLEDQLLSLVIRKERPDLASRKAALIHQGNEFKVRIKQLEDVSLPNVSRRYGIVVFLALAPWPHVEAETPADAVDHVWSL